MSRIKEIEAEIINLTEELERLKNPRCNSCDMELVRDYIVHTEYGSEESYKDKDTIYCDGECLIDYLRHVGDINTVSHTDRSND